MSTINQLLLAQVNIGEEFGVNFQERGGSLGNAPTSPGEFVTWILPQLYTVSLVLLLVYLIWGGYRYLVSGGDPKAVQGAKQHLTYAIAGLIIIFLSYWMFNALDFILLETFKQ